MHVVFTGPCPDDLLESISETPKLAERIMTVLEANVDFQLFEDNVFTTKDQSTEIPKSKQESLAFADFQTKNQEKLLYSACDRLVNIFSPKLYMNAKQFRILSKF